jgi:uncharacterized protein DUF4238
MAPVTDGPETRRPLVPAALLARFADESGRIMAERRDRTRRLTLSATEAAAQIGAFSVLADGLAESLSAVESHAMATIDRILAGAFPPRGADRAGLALFLAVQLALERGHREPLARSAEALGELILARLAELGLEAEGDETTSGAEAVEPAGDVVVHEGDGVRVSLAGTPRVAAVLAARTWQLLRFPGRLVLTGDTPVVLWSRPRAEGAYQFGIGSADEVRVPLDPSHALILARKAAAGEVVRDLDERHARALNRTVAEAASDWMYYRPDADPLEAVELARSS